jgi:hypothetical protein
LLQNRQILFTRNRFLPSHLIVPQFFWLRTRKEGRRLRSSRFEDWGQEGDLRFTVNVGEVCGLRAGMRHAQIFLRQQLRQALRNSGLAFRLKTVAALNRRAQIL